MNIFLGTNSKTNRAVWLNTLLLRTHLHLIGATGTGKSSAILTLFRSLMLQPKKDKAAIFVIDPLGNLSRDLLAVIAHPTWSNDDVRDRLVYIEPAREDVVVPFNPLLHTTEGNRYFRVSRAMTIVLRAFQAQDLSQQPRLARWLFNSFMTAAAMGIPIAACEYLLVPGSPEHKAILLRMPESYRVEWNDILRSNSQALQTLDSTRNRLQPFFKSPILKRMFGVQESHFNCERFIRERKIVILNLGSYGKLAERDGDTIGAMAFNEIIEVVRQMATDCGRDVVEPTYVFLDEFSRFVGNDIADAIATVRQMGLRCVFAHQSFSQLEKGDVDLTQMIYQARSRLVFANSGEDADRCAYELARLTFDPKEVKEERYSWKQLIMGYRKDWLKNHSQSSTRSQAEASNRSSSENESRSHHTEQVGSSHSIGESHVQATSNTSGLSNGDSTGESQVNVPIHKTFRELASREYQSLPEYEVEWGQRIRRLKVGEAFWQEAEAESVPKIQVDYVPIEQDQETRLRVEALIERNFKTDVFITADEADQEVEACRQQLLGCDPMPFEREIQNRDYPKPLDQGDADTSPGDPPFTL